MRFRSVLVGVSALLAPFLLPTTATAGCVSTSRTISGRIGGEDGRFVDVLMGFDLIDYRGQHIDGRTPGSSTYGCGGYHGYGKYIHVNPTLPATGSTTQGTKSWTITVPSTVRTIIIETYPHDPAYQGGVNQTRYGGALRWKVPIPYGQLINIRLPLVCAVGGSVGGINGWVSKNGVRVKADFVGAWSMGKDNNSFSPILGWNMGTAYDNGYYVIPNLKTGQTYTIQVHKDGKIYQPYNLHIQKCTNIYVGARF